MDFVTQQLLNGGISKFLDDYDRLLNNLIGKKSWILT